MIERLAARPWLVVAMLGGYYALNILIRTLVLPDSLEQDEAEQVLLSQWFALGYNAQPPFYTWMQRAVFALTGVNIFALALMKNLALFAIMVLAYLSARLLTRDPVAALAGLFGMFTIPQLFYESQRDLTHSVAVSLAAMLLFYAVLRALIRPGLGAYLLAGLAGAIGFLSKYNFALIAFGLATALLADREGRRRLADPRVLAGLALAILLVLPHGLWLLDNLDLATERTFRKIVGGDETGPFSQIAASSGELLFAILGFVGMTLAVFALACLGVVGPRSFFAHANRFTRLIEHAWLGGLMIPLALIVLVGADTFRDRWFMPLFLMLPVYLALRIDLATRGQQTVTIVRRLAIVALAVMVAVPAALVGRLVSDPWTADYARINIPFQAFIAAVSESEGQKGRSFSRILVGDTVLGGNIVLFDPDITVDPLVPGYRDETDDWLNRDLPGPDTPVLLAWRSDGSANPPMPPILLDWLAGHGQTARVEQHVLDLPWQYGRDGDLYSFGYAIVYRAP